MTEGLDILDRIVLMLSDGEWHTREQIISKLDKPQVDVEAAVRFLAQYEIIEYDEREGRLRITPRTKRWLELLTG